MFDILDAVLERARARGASDVEVFAERSTSRRIKVYRQEVEQLTAAQRRGLGVRVFAGGAVGHAYTSDLSDGALDAVVQRAVDHAAVSDPDEFAAVPEPAGEPAERSLETSGRVGLAEAKDPGPDDIVSETIAMAAAEPVKAAP